MGYHRSELCQRSAVSFGLGGTLPAGTRHHPGGPHQPRAHSEGGSAARSGALRAAGLRSPEASAAVSGRIPVTILGATGTVGQKFVRLLADHPWFEVAAVAASSASAGKRYEAAARWRETTPLPRNVAGLVVQDCAPPLPGRIVFSALDA